MLNKIVTLFFILTVLTGCTSIGISSNQFTIQKDEVVERHVGNDVITVQIAYMNYTTEYDCNNLDPNILGLKECEPGGNINYVLTVNGEEVSGNMYNSTDYYIETIDSDYESWAKVKLLNWTTSCKQIDDTRCWELLAKRNNDPSLCKNFPQTSLQDACFEKLAQDLKQDDLCDQVQSAKDYCQYQKALQKNDISICTSVDYSWKATCYKHFAEKTGLGERACDSLSELYKQGCINLVNY